MTLSDLLWNANLDLARACLDCPFVRGLATGTLPPDKFATYTGQDAFFLKAFARAYSVAAARSPDWEGFQTFHHLVEGVLDEMALHREYAKEWGVDLEAIEPSLATRRYIDFLSATAWSADVGTTAAAMSPCMRLYFFLGRELARDGIPDHRYSEWIRTYSSDEFEPLAKQLEALVERYATDTPALHQTYRYAMQCELEFFESAWRSQ
ncbi:thiaminease II involved in salvage of thiamine pyrimidine moiety [Geitlerinema sp. FC II]|nr:TenA family protein [Geitlerinema sp. CS-897]PPT07803.1 thiaminease II involved in salvage of thiamine pyrimidine moiety [Geitlerinema sp. FC II]